MPTSPSQVPRQSLHFDNFPAVLAYVRAMSACEHKCTGNWTLAQVCWHLARTFHGSIDGFLLKGHTLRRILLGRRILAWTFRHGIPPGVTLDTRLNPPPDCELEDCIALLTQAIERYQCHKGRLNPHPIFGRLRRKAWDRLHCFHCAHHLSFIVPLDPKANANCSH